MDNQATKAVLQTTLRRSGLVQSLCIKIDAATILFTHQDIYITKPSKYLFLHISTLPRESNTCTEFESPGICSSGIPMT